MPTPNVAVYEAARALHAAGFSVVPPEQDGSKKPIEEMAK